MKKRSGSKAEQTAIEDIAKETPDKVITPEELRKFGFAKDSLTMKTLPGMPYATPEQIEEIRSVISEKIKNPNQRKKSEEFLKSLGAPESKVSPPIPLALSKEELIPAIEQDKNAYAAIERLAGRKAALDQLAGDQYVGAKGLLQEEVLPFSGPEQQKQYQDYVSPEDRRYVQNRITGLKAAEKRQEYRTKQEVEQTQLQEMPQAIEEALGEEGAFKQIAVPEITQIPEYRKKLSSGLAKYVKSGRKKPPLSPEEEHSELKKYLESEGNSELDYSSEPKDEPGLEELRFMETPAAKEAMSSPEAFKQEVKKFLGREPETEDIRVATSPSAAKMKGVPKQAVAQAEIGGKKATFFTKRIPSGKEISVFMHEVGAHVGMKNLIGETNYNYLIKQITDWAADPKKELKNEIARAAVQRIPSTTKESAVDDELLAYFISEAVERGVSPRAIAKVNNPLGKFFKYVMQGIKDILKQLGLPGYEPTTQDIVDLAYGAAQLTYERAAKAQKKAARAETKEAKTEAPATAYMEAAPTKKTLETDEEAAAVLTRPAQYVSMRNSGARKLIERADEIINSLNPTVRPSLSFIERVIEGLSRVALKIYVRLLSITQLAEIVKNISPALSAALNKIHELASNRDVNVSNQKQRIQDFIDTARKTVAKYSPEIADKLYTFMHESSIGEVKFDFDKRLKEATAAHQAALKNVPKDVGNQIKDAQAKKDTQREQQLRSLVDARDRTYLNLKELIADHKRVQDDPKLRKLFDDFEKFEQKYPDLGKLYYDLRDEYRNLADAWSDVLNQPELLGPAGKIINDLIKKRIDPYFPLYRRGDFWVRYVDKDGAEGVSAFETGQEAREFVRFLKTEGVQDKDITEYIKPTEAQMESMMPLGQMQEVIKILKQKSASPEVLESIYDIYLDMFSNQSVMQAFKKRKGLQGYRNDALANFADVGTRMAINIEQFKTVRRLDEILREAKTLANKELPQFMGEAVESMLNASEPFLKNPVQKTMFGRFASAASHNAYRWYILGNISSALINTSQIPMVVAPLLSGKFGLTESVSALIDATKMYWAGGFDDNTTMLSPFTGRNLSDRSFAGKKTKLSEEYQRLYQNAIQRGAIRRSVGQDLMAMRNLGVADPENKAAYKMMQVEQSMGWLFQNAERFNREVTLLAAYKLAKKDGMSEAEATDYALNLIEFSHGSAMSELGPQLLQSGFGKLLGVFKRFAFNQMYLQAKLFYDAFGGADAKTKAVARRQLLGIYATTFAFAGLKGVPAYGLINVLASMIFGDDDEPFSLDDALLTTFGPIGFSGPFGYYTNVGVAGRLGFGDLLWRPDEKRLAELGPLMYTIENMAGPVYSVVDNLRKGMGQMAEGNVMKGLETATPSALKSFFRTYRFATEGVLNSKGYKIIEDPNFADLVMSATGITPNDHNIAYEQLSIVKGFERKALERRSQLLDRRAAAIRVGDYDGLRDIDKQIFDFNKSKFGRGYRIEEDTKRKSLKQRKIQEQRAIQAGTFGSNVNPRLLKEAKEAAGLE
jgi:hypothetical protein